MPEFFDYCCDQCGRPFCERIHVMNMVLDHIEEEYCLECLSAAEEQTPEGFYDWILEYVNARDCFKGPWEKFNAAPCPRITDKTCFCKVASA